MTFTRGAGVNDADIFVAYDENPRSGIGERAGVVGHDTLNERAELVAAPIFKFKIPYKRYRHGLDTFFILTGSAFSLGHWRAV